MTSSEPRGRRRSESYRLGANSYVVKQFDAAKPGEYLVDIARYWLDLNRVVRAEWPSPAVMPAPTALIVDDDANYRRILEVLVEREGFATRVASSLADARVKLAARPRTSCSWT